MEFGDEGRSGSLAGLIGVLAVVVDRGTEITFETGLATSVLVEGAGGGFGAFADVRDARGTVSEMLPLLLVGVVFAGVAGCIVFADTSVIRAGLACWADNDKLMPNK